LNRAAVGIGNGRQRRADPPAQISRRSVQHGTAELACNTTEPDLAAGTAQLYDSARKQPVPLDERKASRRWPPKLAIRPGTATGRVATGRARHSGTCRLRQPTFDLPRSRAGRAVSEGSVRSPRRAGPRQQCPGEPRLLAVDGRVERAWTARGRRRRRIPGCRNPCREEAVPAAVAISVFSAVVSGSASSHTRIVTDRLSQSTDFSASGLFRRASVRN